ncbi:AaceriAAL110Cp [[Ashbya] aceris (nom. inval.)]|nr:AaceriAAL110Cp [[Ashbya] aceris (nom. inval.)]
MSNIHRRANARVGSKNSNVDNGVLQKELLEEQKQEIYEAFSLFDMNNDGYLDFHEFKVALRALGFEMDKRDILDIIDKYDTDGRRLISYDDFYLVVGEMILQRDPLDEIKRAFKLFDDDHTGKISIKNLKRVVKELGENLTDQELAAMIDEFDLDGDGEINEEEFIAICTDN